LGDILNIDIITSPVIDQKPELQDFYNNKNEYEVTAYDKKKYNEYLEKLTEEEKEILNGNWNYYQMKFSNLGGLPMPIILRFTYEDGSMERHYIPAEIWKNDQLQVSKVFYSKKMIASVTVDPNLETADIDRENNYWPQRIQQNRFELYKNRGRYGDKEKLNDMQKAKKK